MALCGVHNRGDRTQLAGWMVTADDHSERLENGEICLQGIRLLGSLDKRSLNSISWDFYALIQREYSPQTPSRYRCLLVADFIGV